MLLAKPEFKFIRNGGCFLPSKLVTALRQALLTVPEAAFVAGVSQRMVQHEIDERIVEAKEALGRRSMLGIEVLYLNAIRPFHGGMAPKLRRQLRDAIVKSAAQNREVFQFEVFVVSLMALEDEVRAEFDILQRVKNELIQKNPEILGGEPVISGTRIAVRLIAELIRKGATSEELQSEFDLTSEQVSAALLFDRVNPKRGRPRLMR